MTQLGIEHSKKVLADISELATDVVQIVKHYSLFAAIGKFSEIKKDTLDLMSEASKSLPELKDLDKAEASQLAAACYDLLRSIVTAIAA